MKTTVYFSDFAQAFRDMDRSDNFSCEGLKALFDFLEELEAATGYEHELDVIALCCEYYESTAADLIQDYQIDVSEAEGDEDEIESIIEEYLSDNTMLVGKLGNGSFVYAAF